MTLTEIDPKKLLYFASIIEHGSLNRAAHAPRSPIARDMIALGASYVSAGSDTGFLMSAAKATAGLYR